MNIFFSQKSHFLKYDLSLIKSILEEDNYELLEQYNPDNDFYFEYDSDEDQEFQLVNSKGKYICLSNKIGEYYELKLTSSKYYNQLKFWIKDNKFVTDIDWDLYGLSDED